MKKENIKKEKKIINLEKLERIDIEVKYNIPKDKWDEFKLEEYSSAKRDTNNCLILNPNQWATLLLECEESNKQSIIASYIGCSQTTVSRKLNDDLIITKIMNTVKNYSESKKLPIRSILNDPDCKIYEHIHTFFISIDDMTKKERLSKLLLNAYSATDSNQDTEGSYGIIDIVETNRGLLIITDDLYMSTRLYNIRESN